MKKIILAISLVVSSIFANDINVEVKWVLSQKGRILIGLYNKDDENFASTSKYYKVMSLRVKSNELRYTFKNIPDGIYAIAIVHDENENTLLDTNFLGFPSEGYGFSNNIRPIFRAAK